MSAKIDDELIGRIVSTFPSAGEWRRFECRVVCTDGPNATWMPLNNLDGVGGVYAFMLPTSIFNGRQTIDLHGPGGARIPFEFRVATLLADGCGVVYVGRSSDLKQRWHDDLSMGTRAEGSQVKYGLLDCGLFNDNETTALDYLRRNGQIIYHVLSGPDHCANRDIIEVTLTAQLRPAFNIKSEH